MSYSLRNILLLGVGAMGLTACAGQQAGTSTLQSSTDPAPVAAAPNLHPHEGSGIVGSPTMLKLGAEWEPMNQSAAKYIGRQRFRDNKYGMFIHWGLYSTLGGVWQGKTMEETGEGPTVAEWVMRRKQIPRSEYAKLAERFNPVDFNARDWVAVAKAAGMKYIVITSKHHDGFALFDSEVSKFNAVDATPFGRDIIRELEQACKEAGLAFGVYYSHALDWRDGGDSGWKDYQPPHASQRRNMMPNRYDPSPQSFDDYIANKSLPQVRELVANYDLSQIWFDTPIFIPPEYSMAFYHTVYEADPEILVNQRVGNGFGDIGTPGDNVIPDAASDNIWEGIATTNNSWGFKSYDTDWKSPQETLFWLVENVSKGGNFLLNVGPDGTGRIPPESVTNLLAVGAWLKANGEAIYGSYPWRVTHEGPTKIAMKGTGHREKAEQNFEFTDKDFWFTQKDGSIYAISFNRPADGKIVIASLQGQPIKAVRLLDNDADLNWASTSQGLAVTLPAFKEDGIGYALEITPAVG